jgi:hypothetical protein
VTQPIALWSSLNLLPLAQHCWIKVKPECLDINLLLERQLAVSRLLGK